MKLNNHLIVTLPDFVKHFSFTDFWENRFQFVRDMHPDKVYYWDEELKEAYFNVARWINQDKNADKTVKDRGINALEKILEGKLDRDSVCIYDSVDFTSQIIRVMSGQTLTLPEYTGSIAESYTLLRLHKIEVYGRPAQSSKIKIGNKECLTLQTGDFVYVTEVDNCFIEFLPNHLQNEIYDLSLVSQDGDFFSTLVVHNLFSASRLTFKDVTSFALTNDGYIYVDANKKPIIMSNSVPKFMLKYEGEAFYVKANNNNALVLYNNGILRSTIDMSAITKVISASIDRYDHLEYRKVLDL